MRQDWALKPQGIPCGLACSGEKGAAHSVKSGADGHPWDLERWLCSHCGGGWSEEVEED